MQDSRPHPGLLSRNLHCNEIPGDSSAHQGLRPCGSGPWLSNMTACRNHWGREEILVPPLSPDQYIGTSGMGHRLRHSQTRAIQCAARVGTRALGKLPLLLEEKVIGGFLGMENPTRLSTFES